MAEASQDSVRPSAIKRMWERLRRGKPQENIAQPVSIEDADLLAKARAKAQETKEATIGEYKSAVIEHPSQYSSGPAPELSGVYDSTINLVTTRTDLNPPMERPSNLTHITTGMNDQQAAIAASRVENAGPQPQNISQPLGNVSEFKPK